MSNFEALRKECCSAVLGCEEAQQKVGEVLGRQSVAVSEDRAASGIEGSDGLWV
jgi:hypothetical protein